MVPAPDSPNVRSLEAGTPTAFSPLQVSAPAWARAERLWAAGAPLPWLHQEVARRMAERLAVIRMQPQVMMEWDALPGQSRKVLQTAYPEAQWLPVAGSSLSLQRLQSVNKQARPGALVPTTRTVDDSTWRTRLSAWWRQSWSNSAARPMPEPPPGFLVEAVPPAHAQLLWSNLSLHTYADPRALLKRWHAALAVDGFLMFSTFGPGTLRELRKLWEEAGWGPGSQLFRDMHDWGDDLVAAGFADPVMDQEVLTLTWADAETALAELRTLGRNAHPDRHPGCRTPRWKARLKEALQRRAGPDERIRLTFEIIYGHAFRPIPRARVESLSTVSLDDMRHMVQTARRSV